MEIKPNRMRSSEKYENAGTYEYAVTDADGRGRELSIRRTYPLPFVADGKHNAPFHVILTETNHNGGVTKTIGILLSDRQVQELFMAYALMKQEYETGVEVDHDTGA